MESAMHVSTHVWRYDGYNWSKQMDLHKRRSDHRTIRINSNYMAHVGGRNVLKEDNR